jgi:hypothetical protein
MSDTQFSAREIRLIVGLADGSLPAGEREAAEREVLCDPERRAALERQRRAVAAVRAARPPAPDELRRGIEAQMRVATPRRVRRHALAGLAATAALALLMVLLPLGPPQAPPVTEVAALAERGVGAPAPAPDPRHRGHLAEHTDGVPYPDWTDAFGWRAHGARADELAGRRAETVFYEHDGHVIGYTIIEGDPLEPPRDARRVVRNGREIHAWKDGARDVVTFQRDGRTCVLSGDVLARETLIALAAWRPGMPGSHAHAQA